MKKILAFTLILTLSATTFCQQVNPLPGLNKQDLLKKSKNQKTAAWILLGGGFFSTALGSVKFNFAGSDSEVDNSTSAIFLITGLAAIATSIPFFIAANKNKKKAMNLSFKNEKVTHLSKQAFVYKTIPSLALKINL